MDKIPFTFYDFFGYLAPGFHILAVFDYVFLKSCLFHSDKSSVAFWVLLVGGAYLLGHVTAFFSYGLYERTLIRRIFQKPATNLFLERKKNFWTLAFGHYFESFPRTIKLKILKKASDEWLVIYHLSEAASSGKTFGNRDISRQVDEDLKSIYLHAYGRVKINELAMAQQDTFLRLYGFARNISFSSLIATILIVINCFLKGISSNWHWLVIFFAAFLAMFTIYLKFYRWFSREIFLAYAELPPQKASNEG